MWGKPFVCKERDQTVQSQWPMAALAPHLRQWSCSCAMTWQGEGPGVDCVLLPMLSLGAD